jgi:hypothetical protein
MSELGNPENYKPPQLSDKRPIPSPKEINETANAHMKNLPEFDAPYLLEQTEV